MYLAVWQSLGEVFPLLNTVSWFCDPMPVWDFYLSHRMAPGKRVWIAEQMKGNCRGKGWKDPSFHRKLKGYCLQEIEYRSFERWEPEPQFEAIRPHEKAELCFAFNDVCLDAHHESTLHGEARHSCGITSVIMACSFLSGLGNQRVRHWRTWSKPFLLLRGIISSSFFFLWAACSTWACII